ncbi:YbaN family protein [Pontiellaceae bacterium B12219]|nr:YbaN family protein [Pontiellaceae bacterium B12219]
MKEKYKWIFLTAGILLVGLAALGTVLPLLPTTPLLLLAAWCFAHSSEKCHRWLIEHRLFGPILKNWQEKKCIPFKAKLLAVGSMVVFGTYAIGFALENCYLRLFGALLLIIGLITVLRLKTCRKTIDSA